MGITEPTYGPSALHSVAEQTKDVPFTELKKDDLAWIVMDSTNVESKSFYMTTDEGYLGLVQVIYSNVLYASLPDCTLAEDSVTDRTTEASVRLRSLASRSSTSTPAPHISGLQTMSLTSPSPPTNSTSRPTAAPWNFRLTVRATPSNPP